MNHLKFFLDTNCVNARQRNVSLNALERARAQGRVTLIYSDAAYGEAAFNNAARSDKVAKYSCIAIDPLWGRNDELRAAIELILFPNGARSQNERNDVLAVYQAERLRWPLVTTDGASKRQPGGILGRAAELARLGIEVLSPEVAYARVRSAVDDAAARRATRTSTSTHK